MLPKLLCRKWQRKVSSVKVQMYFTGGTIQVYFLRGHKTTSGYIRIIQISTDISTQV